MTRVAVVQVNPLLGAVPQNIARCLALAGKEKADIYVFPELVTTGYNFSSLKQLEGLAEPANRGMAFNAFSRFAVERKCYVCYGFAEASKAGIYNSASLIGPKKMIGTYRKTHLFDRETRFFRPGNSGLNVYSLPFGRVGIMICFDWFFPEAMRTLALRGAQLVLHPANLVLPFCPDGLKIRCLENRVFVASADRTGKEGRDPPLKFIGMSEIVSPGGKILARLGRAGEGVAVVDCDLSTSTSKSLNRHNNLFKDRRPHYYEH